MTAYKVRAHWDENDSIWWAECSEYHGIVAEAATVESLLDAIQRTFPDLVDLDLQLGPEDVGAPIRLAVQTGTWVSRASSLRAA
jgi:Domain of unknown function (DUF1902)